MLASQRLFLGASLAAWGLVACGGDSKLTCTRDSDCPAGLICVDLGAGNGNVCAQNPTDGGPTRDGGRADAGVADGGALEDGGAVDAAVASDGGEASDGGSSADGGGGEDGGGAIDGGALGDGGAAIDGGALDDGGAAIDGGALEDGGATDGGAAVCLGETCDTAVALAGASGVLANEPLRGCTNHYSTAGDTFCGRAGGDRVFSALVPAGQRLTAVVEPEPGPNEFDPGIYLIRGPVSGCKASLAASDCLDADDSGGAATVNGVRYTNRGATDETVFVVIDAFYASGPNAEGEFRLAWIIETPPAGETCSNASALVSGTPQSGDTLSGYYDDAAPASCGATEGADRFYSISVPQNQRLSVSLNVRTVDGGIDAAFNPHVYLLGANHTACGGGATACLASAASTSTFPKTLLWANTGTSAATVYVVVDAGSLSADGAFDLQATIETLPSGDSCAQAEPLTVGSTPLVRMDETTVGFSANLSGTPVGGCPASAGIDRVYSLSVPAGQRLTASVVPKTTGYDPGIYVVEGPAANCSANPLVCAAADDTGAAAVTNTLIYNNRSVASKEVFLVVDSFPSGDAGGAYDLTVSVAPAPAGPAGDTCDTAETLTPGTPLMSQTTVGYTNDYVGGINSDACPAANAGPDRAYKVDVPAGERLTVTVTPEATLDPAVSIVAGAAAACDALPRVCASGANNGGAGQPETAAFTNTSASMQTVFVVVDSASSAGGAFTISATNAAVPAGDRCETATPITMSGTFTASSAGYLNDYSGASTGCSGTAGPDRVYQVDVPGNTRLTASVRGTEAFDPSLNLLLSCAAPLNCVASDDSGDAPTLNTAVYINRGTSTRTIFLLIDSFFGDGPGGAFELTTALDAAPADLAGDRCDNAIVISSPGTLTGQTTTGFVSDLAPPEDCTGYETGGPDRVYRITLPAGKTLDATVAREGDEGDPAIYLIRGDASACTSVPTPCLVGDDSGVGETVNEVGYTNETSSDETLFIVIDSISAPVPAFTLTTAITP